MNDAFGDPQSVVVLGGTSDIASALLARVATSGRCRTAILAGRNELALADAARHLHERVLRVETVHFDVTGDDAATTVDRCFESSGEPVDLLVVAVGELGHQESDESDPRRVAEMVTVNFTWPAAALAAAAVRMRHQGHGRIVVLSSVAGYRVRRANFSYGAAKAGLDAFALGLSESLRETGITVHVVRPGFVHTKMTAGRPVAPLAVGPDRVANDVMCGLRAGRTVIWSPGILKWVFAVLRLLPATVWRKLPG